MRLKSFPRTRREYGFWAPISFPDVWCCSTNGFTEMVWLQSQIYSTGEEVILMKRFVLPRIAHCSEGCRAFDKGSEDRIFGWTHHGSRSDCNEPDDWIDSKCLRWEENDGDPFFPLLHLAQKICNRIGIMIKGRMVARGTMDRLAEEKPGIGTKEYTLEEIYMKYFMEE